MFSHPLFSFFCDSLESHVVYIYVFYRWISDKKNAPDRKKGVQRFLLGGGFLTPTRRSHLNPIILLIGQLFPPPLPPPIDVRELCENSAQLELEECMDLTEGLASPEYDFEEFFCVLRYEVRIQLCREPDCEGKIPCPLIEPCDAF